MAFSKSNRWKNFRKPLQYYHYIAYYYTDEKIYGKIRSIIIDALCSLDEMELALKTSIAGVEGEVDAKARLNVRMPIKHKVKKITEKRRRSLKKKLSKNDGILHVNIIIKYTYMKDEKRSYAWADKYHLDIFFSNGIIALGILHEKGLRRISPRDLAKIIYFQAIKMMRKKGIEPRLRELKEIF
ncbi:MAG: hypothetical protein DRJ30_03060 [Candidatus Methanomethylicota archaeon]|nr:MAG: hypothetical protein DRJ30_03060 [Candidatus Verstraetearchaeota archaeon]